MPYAPRPIGWRGGTYLEETWKRFPRILYCTYLPPYSGIPLSFITIDSFSIFFKNQLLSRRRMRKKIRVLAFLSKASDLSLLLSVASCRLALLLIFWCWLSKFERRIICVFKLTNAVTQINFFIISFKKWTKQRPDRRW